MSHIMETKMINTTLREKSAYRIAKGVLFAFTLTLLLLFVFSLILTFSNISEAVIAPVVIIITAISILAGSGISTRKLNKNGLLKGSMVGLLYLCLIYLLSSAVSGNYSLNITSIVLLIVGTFAGGVGGIIGVNLK